MTNAASQPATHICEERTAPVRERRGEAELPNGLVQREDQEEGEARQDRLVTEVGKAGRKTDRPDVPVSPIKTPARRQPHFLAGPEGLASSTSGSNNSTGLSEGFPTRICLPPSPMASTAPG